MKYLVTAFLVTCALIIPAYNSRAQEPSKKDTGENLYKKYECISCHGKKGDKPFDLRKAHEKYDATQIKLYIMNPKKFGNEKMPVFETILRDEDYLPLIEYIFRLGNENKADSK